MMADRIIKEAGVPEDKAPKVKQLLVTHFQAVENWFKDNRENLMGLRQKLDEAAKAKDEAKVKELTTERDKLMSGQKDLAENLKKQLGDCVVKG